MSPHQQAAVSAVPVLSTAHRATLHSLFPGGRGLRVYLNTMLWARKLSPDYDVWVDWDYSRLSNGGFFMAPKDQNGRLYRIDSPNGYGGVVSAEAMGMICCLFTYGQLRYQPWFQPFASDHFHRLREYAGMHRHSYRIYAAIA